MSILLKVTELVEPGFESSQWSLKLFLPSGKGLWNGYVAVAQGDGALEVR